MTKSILVLLIVVLNTGCATGAAMARGFSKGFSQSMAVPPPEGHITPPQINTARAVSCQTYKFGSSYNTICN